MNIRLVPLAALLLLASSAARAGGEACRFVYVRSPTISSFEHGVHVGSTRMAVDASSVTMCDAPDGICAELGHAPLYVPGAWRPGPMTWGYDVYEYDQAQATDDPRANGLTIYPITVFFLDSAGKRTPMAVYFLDAQQNLVGFVPKVEQGNAITSRTTNWKTSPFLLMGNVAPIACFAPLAR